MARQLTEADARDSMTEHARAKGFTLYQRYGPSIGEDELRTILEDREFVRFPCTIVFDASPLEPGEFAHPAPRSDNPQDGYVMYVHPLMAGSPGWVSHAVLYQMVTVNYGDFASSTDAEAFGAAALGLSEDQYYARLCLLADALRQNDEGINVAIPDISKLSSSL